MKFSRTELCFIQDNEVARLATVGPDGIPHVVPVCFIYSSEAFWVATDYETRKYRNLQKNGRVALLVDVGYDSSRGLLVQGRAKTFEKGPEVGKIYAVFYKKFAWVRAAPLKESEAPFIRIKPTRKAGWGLKP